MHLWKRHRLAKKKTTFFHDQKLTTLEMYQVKAERIGAAHHKLGKGKIWQDSWEMRKGRDLAVFGCRVKKISPYFDH